MASYSDSPYGQPGPNQVSPVYNPRMGQGGYPGQFNPPNVGFNGSPPQQGHEEDGNFAYKTLDEENGEARGFNFTDKSIRLAFIRKVLAILMLQLLVTFSFIAMVVFHKPTRKLISNSPEILFAAILTFLVIYIVLLFCENLRRKSPTNYILLIIFTLAQSFFLSVVASLYEPEDVLIAIGLTAAVCLGLTLFALQTKLDFTLMYGIIFVFWKILIIVCFYAIFFETDIYSLMYSSLGAFLFSVYLVYDIQLMVGGKHKYSISPEEYIFAALNLYLDVTRIFFYILSMSRR